MQRHSFVPTAHFLSSDQYLMLSMSYCLLRESCKAKIICSQEAVISDRMLLANFTYHHKIKAGFGFLTKSGKGKEYSP